MRGRKAGRGPLIGSMRAIHGMAASWPQLVRGVTLRSRMRLSAPSRPAKTPYSETRSLWKRSGHEVQHDDHVARSGGAAQRRRRAGRARSPSRRAAGRTARAAISTMPIAILRTSGPADAAVARRARRRASARRSSVLLARHRTPGPSAGSCAARSAAAASGPWRWRSVPMIRQPAMMMSERWYSAAPKIICPSPLVAPTSSAAISARQPKPRPERRP